MLKRDGFTERVDERINHDIDGVLSGGIGIKAAFRVGCGRYVAKSIRQRTETVMKNQRENVNVIRGKGESR